MLNYIFLILLLFVLYIIKSWLYFHKDMKLTNAPGPYPLPIVGNAHLFLSGRTGVLERFKQFSHKYDGMCRIYKMSYRFVLLWDVKYTEAIMSSSEFIYKGRAYDHMQPWLGRGLLTSSGERWHVFRKLLTPAFHFNISRSFLPVFCRNGRLLLDKLKEMADGGPIDIFPIIALTALDNITESTMGVSVQAQKQKDSKYVKAIEDICNVIITRLNGILSANKTLFNILPLKRRQDQALNILHGRTEHVINTRREELTRCNSLQLENDDSGLKKKYPFLDLLLLSEIDGKKIDDQSIRDEVNTFMFEGHDTTASAISFCLYNIAKYQHVQNKIVEEMKMIFGVNAERDPLISDIQQMKYLDMVIKESLRLYPAVPIIERLITKDVDIADLQLPKGTLVVINIFSLHRQARIFEDPLEFRPERFEKPIKNSLSWVPFSAGPRNCIGQKFAMLEMKQLISSVVRQFRLLPVNMEPELCVELTLKSTNGVYVRFLPRK